VISISSHALPHLAAAAPPRLLFIAFSATNVAGHLNLSNILVELRTERQAIDKVIDALAILETSERRRDAPAGGSEPAGLSVRLQR